MSRTYREVPDDKFRDRIKLEDKNGQPRMLMPTEEKKGTLPYTKTVRDKDNNVQSKPKQHRKRAVKRRRAAERDTTREIEKLMRENPTKKMENEWYYTTFDDTDIVMPKPKEVQEYYW